MQGEVGLRLSVRGGVCVYVRCRCSQGSVSAGDAPLGELHVRNVRRTNAGRLQLYSLHRTTLWVRFTQLSQLRPGSLSRRT